MIYSEAGLALAYDEARRSPDPSTQNGAIVAWNDVVLGSAHNRFPRGVADLPERWADKPTKYAHVVHAEVGAVLNAMKGHGNRLHQATLYCAWYACTDCAKVIIESGVRHVVGHHAVRVFAESATPGWTDGIRVALGMLAEAGVRCDWYDGPVNAPAIRVGGRTFDPTAPVPDRAPYPGACVAPTVS